MIDKPALTASMLISPTETRVDHGLELLSDLCGGAPWLTFAERVAFLRETFCEKHADLLVDVVG